MARPVLHEGKACYIDISKVLHITQRALLLHFSYYLWSISSPGRNGYPRVDLSEDPTAQVTSHNLTPCQLQLERVITKTLTDNCIPLDITDTIWASFTAKLWRMGKHFSSLGTKNRKAQLEMWAGSNWSFTVNETEVVRQVLSRKREADELDLERTKCQRLEKLVS